MKKDKVTVLAFFMIFPIYTLPWILKSMLKNEYFGYILFSLLMGFYAYLMVPYNDFDMARHYEMFNWLKKADFGDVLALDDLVRSFFLFYMMVIGDLGFPKEFVAFSIVTMTYIFYLVAYRKLIIYSGSFKDFRNHNEKELMLLLFLVLSSIAFINSASGMRNYVAISASIFAIVNHILRGSVMLTVGLFLLAYLFHFSIIGVLLVFFLSGTSLPRNMVRLGFIISFVLLVSGQIGTIYYFLLKIITPALAKLGLYNDAYLTGGLGVTFYEMEDITGNLIFFEKVLLTVPLYLIGLYFLFNKNPFLPRIQKFMYLMFIYVAIISVSRTLFMRYSYFLLLFFILFLVFEVKRKSFKQVGIWFIPIFTASLISINIARVYTNRALIETSWTKTLYTPALILFFDHVEKDEVLTGN